LVVLNVTPKSKESGKIFKYLGYCFCESQDLVCTYFLVWREHVFFRVNLNLKVLGFYFYSIITLLAGKNLLVNTKIGSSWVPVIPFYWPNWTTSSHLNSWFVSADLFNHLNLIWFSSFHRFFAIWVGFSGFFHPYYSPSITFAKFNGVILDIFFE
jgi:hypothetical protein